MSMQEALKRIAECKRTRHTVLDLRNLSLNRLPDELWELEQLEVLLLGHPGVDRPSRIATLPPQIGNLRRLKSLNASNLWLQELPPEMGYLTNLEGLDLSGNQLEILPLTHSGRTILGEMHHLRNLYLSGNQLSVLPTDIGQLRKLEMLYLNHNQLTSLPNEIGYLTQLKILGTNHNKLTVLPISIGELSELTYLELGANHLTKLPDSLSRLTMLIRLDIYSNQLTELPQDIGNLHALTDLYLYQNRIERFPPSFCNLTDLTLVQAGDNRLSEIPAEIGNLKHLNTLSLYNNQIAEVPPQLGALPNLKILDLAQNQLTKLPIELTNLTQLRELYLGDNNLSIPVELLSAPENPTAILAYLLAGRTVPIDEVKVVVVGEADVGKSALVRRLVRDTFEDTRSPTRGIAIQDWQMAVNGREITLHLWDFGGQEIMHNTHRLFLSVRSLYLLVVDNSRNPESNRVEEWLKTIRFYAPDAPILLVSNKSDLESVPLALNQTELRRTYGISAYHKVSSASGTGIETLRQAIGLELAQMPHLTDGIPVRWLAVRQAVAEQQRDYLDFAEFRALCDAQGVGETSQSIAEFLDLLGVLLHYRTRRATAITQILNPNWVTEGIYPLLTNRALIERGTGIITDSDLDALLEPSRYPHHQHPFILGMMYTFELAFDLGNERHLVPDLLPKEEPPNAWAEGEALRFVYNYDYLPPGLFTRLIVALQHQIVPQWVWRGGAILYHRGLPYARLLVRPSLNRIDIEVRPPASLKTDPRTLLNSLRDAFDRLHEQAFKEPQRVQELIPYGDGMIAYEALLQFEGAGYGGRVFFPPHGYIQVGELLTGIRVPLALSPDTGVLQPMAQSFGATPWRVAAFFANPADSAYLPALRQEEREIRELLSRHVEFVPDTITNTRLRDLQSALDRPGAPLVIFHYSGHADERGIWLENETGDSQQILSWLALAQELRHQPRLRCVILNGCKSLHPDFVETFGDRAPAIIAMSAPIGDEKAKIFATRFYESLVVGNSLSVAFDKACTALHMEGYEADADVPRLILE